MGKSRFLKYPFERKAAQKNAFFGSYPVVMAQGGFSPRSLLGLHMWLDFSDANALLINTGLIETAYDKSGNGNHVTQAVSGNRPTLTANARNGLSCATYAGGQSLYQVSNTIGAFTVFIVYRSTNNAGIVYRRGTGSYVYSGNVEAASVDRGGTVSSYTGTTGWLGDGTCQIVRHRFDGTHAGHTLHRNALNYVGKFLTTSAGSSPGTGSSTEYFSLGASYPGVVSSMTGEIYEVVIYNRALTSAECYAVETYLANKWAMIATPEMFTRLFDFDASQGVTLNGATVSDWADQSGNSRHVAQANPTYQPTYTASWRNGKPAILFEGKALPKFMQSAQFGPVAVPYTLLLANQWTDTPSTGGNTALNASDVSPVFAASAGVCIHYFTSTPMYVTSGDQAYFDQAYYRAPSSFLDPHLLAYNVGSPATCYHNGRSMVKTMGSGLMTRAMNRVQLGAFRDDLSTPYSGYIARVCGLSGERSADEMARLAFHMNREYAL